MKQKHNITPKQRLTAFVDPVLVKRAKVRGALEELTLSEVVEKALEAYAPKIESDSDKLIQLKFNSSLAIDTHTARAEAKRKRGVPKYTKDSAKT